MQKLDIYKDGAILKTIEENFGTESLVISDDNMYKIRKKVLDWLKNETSDILTFYYDPIDLSDVGILNFQRCLINFRYVTNGWIRYAVAKCDNIDELISIKLGVFIDNECTTDPCVKNEVLTEFPNNEYSVTPFGHKIKRVL